MGMMHEWIIPMIDILTTHEVAHELRCSKAHVSKAIAGKLPNVTPLPAIPMGRRKLVRRSALMSEWKRMNAVPYILPRNDAVNA